jgi:SAM-dependent methyltransferase
MLVAPALLLRYGSKILIACNAQECALNNVYQVLAPYVTTIRGIDVSDGMVDKYNEAARKQGLSEHQMYAVRGDLLGPEAESSKALEGADFFNFDIIVISMALHHVEDPQLMTVKLVERLKDKGSLLVIDWAPALDASESSTQDHKNNTTDEVGYQQDLKGAHKTMNRSGFAEDEMKKFFEVAGCSESDYVLHPNFSRLPARFGGAKQLFFARGRK